MNTYNEIKVSVGELLRFGGELNRAVAGLSKAVEKAENEKLINEEAVCRLKEECSELESLVDCVMMAVAEYERLEKNIIDVLANI